MLALIAFMSLFGIVKEAFFEARQPRLWLYFLIVWFFSFLASFLVSALTIDLFFGDVYEDPVAGFQSFFSSPFEVIVLGTIAFVVFLALSVLLEAAIAGFELNGARMFLSGEKSISVLLKKSWLASKPRIVAGFFLSLLSSFVVLCLFFVFAVILAMLFFGLGFAQSPNILAVALAVFFVLLGTVLLIALLPFLFLVYPVVFFEGLGVTASAKRVFSLARANFFRNLKFVLLFALAVVGLILFLILFVFLLVFLAIALFFIPVVGWLFAAIVAIVAVLLLVAGIIWLSSFEVIAVVKYYELASGESITGKPLAVSYPARLPVVSSPKWVKKKPSSVPAKSKKK